MPLTAAGVLLPVAAASAAASAAAARRREKHAGKISTGGRNLTLFDRRCCAAPHRGRTINKNDVLMALNDAHTHTHTHACLIWRAASRGRGDGSGWLRNFYINYNKRPNNANIIRRCTLYARCRRC